MLVVTRKSSEGLILNTSDGEVRIKLSTGNPNIPVKVAIEAPESVEIVREELVDRSN